MALALVDIGEASGSVSQKLPTTKVLPHKLNTLKKALKGHLMERSHKLTVSQNVQFPEIHYAFLLIGGNLTFVLLITSMGM